LDFTVNFSENVTVVTTGGTPQLGVTIGSTLRQATYVSGSGTSALLFRYTIQTGETDNDGVVVGTLAANGGTLRDGAGNNANLALNSVGVTTGVLVDAVASVVTSVAVPPNATYIAGQNLEFTVNFNENITVVTTGGTPQLGVTIGSTLRQAAYVSGSGTNALLFRYTVQAGEADSDGIVVGTLVANGGTLRDGAGNNANLALNSVGVTTAVLVDAVAPTVTSVTVPPNATYGDGQNLDFTVNFSENVTVVTTGGTPQLGVMIGSTLRQATYVSGSGTNALLFRYTVQTGESDNDGVAVGTLTANGGTLRDAIGNDAVLALNSIGATTGVLVDAVASTVTSVTVPPNATYIAGQNLDFTVNFNENITVVTTGGTPQLGVTVGSTLRQATYISGSGTNALLFRYTVQAGELDTDGVAVGTLVANGGTLRDGAGNNANLALNSIGATTAVLVDAVIPTVTSVTVPANATYGDGQNLDFTVNFSENVTVVTTGGTPQLGVTIGSTLRQATYVSGSGTSALLFRYTIQTGETDNDGVVVGTLAANGGTLRDGAGNNANLALNSVGATTGVLVDAVAPVVTSVAVPPNATYIAGQNLEFTVNFNENITVVTTGGTPQLGVTIGSTLRQAAYVSGSGTGALLFRYTVQAGEADSDGIVVGTLAANGGTLRDGAGNNANLALNSVGATTAVLVDAVAPTVTSVTVPSNATYGSGQNLNFTVNFSENVTVVTTGGTPQLGVMIGSTLRQATYVSGSGTNALLFRYTVQTGESDNDGVVVGTLAANGGTLRDAIGNDAVLALNSIGATTAVLVDAVAPTVVSITRQTPTNAITNANILTYRVTFSEEVRNVNVGGNDFEVSGTTASIIVASASATSYEVTISGGDLTNLNGTVTLSFRSTQDITDRFNNALVNTTPTGTNENTYTLDNTAPTVTSFTRKTPNTQRTNADQVTFLATFSEDVTGVDLADFAATGPTGATITVTQLTASTYDVQISGGDMAALNGTVGLNLRATASVVDAAGNTLTIAEPATDETYTLDNTAPTIVSFTRGNPTNMITSADQVTFRVSFDTQVINVDAADFEVTGTTATITSVTEASPGLFDVLVSGGDLATLNGTVGLNFAAGVSITDDVGNAFVGAEPGTDETYTLCNGPNNPVTGVMLGTATANSIPFTSFTAPVGGAAGYVVKINNSNTFTTLTNGALPTANTTWAGAGEQVIYAGTSVNPGITVTGLTSGITYYFKVFAYNDCGGTNTFESTGTEANTATPKADQTITFALGADATKTFGDAPFNLNGTASSGLAVTYTSSNTAVATISGNTVTIVGVGTTTITASQAGNTNFNAAPDVTQTLTVNKADQTITFGALASRTIGEAPFDLTATASSGLAVTYTSSNTAVATISGSTVTIVGIGTTTITASQPGNANYNAAADVTQDLTVIDAPVMAVSQGTTALVSGTGNYNFGNVDVNQNSTAVTFTIANSGGADLQLNGNPIVAISGANSGEFMVTQPTGATVAANGNTTFQVVFTPTTAGTRTATVSIANNSATNPYTFTITGEGVFVANNLAAPNLFTPNGDGRNDAFLISAPTLATVKLTIYNRKGAVVFSSSDVNEVTQVGWNGEANGQKLPTGTYIWQITGTYQDGTAVERKTGEIYLVR
ncbi:MAG TPA: hypothetical protein DCS93_05560, partial [Microscillaceae bacterium]|nr:hypothetical protein [Microscillaceae bacterium]